jgi:hypothetical protein
MASLQANKHPKDILGNQIIFKMNKPELKSGERCKDQEPQQAFARERNA